MKYPNQNWKNYIELTRLNKPIGIYLLLWPTLWALWFAAKGWPGWHLFLVFTLGTILTRSAGCIVNDLADRKFDGHVTRTKNRVLVAGYIKPPKAIILAIFIASLALLLVMTTNLLTISLAMIAAAIAVVYPFMKRYTYMPQVILGVAFSMGIPMAFSAATGEVDNIGWLILTANLLWVVAYDTQYAMVDRDDDVRLGLKSTAILFADLDWQLIGLIQLTFILSMLLVGHNLKLSQWYFFGLAAASILFIYQHYLTRNRLREGYFNAFLNNNWVGLVIFAGISIHYYVI